MKAKWPPQRTRPWKKQTESEIQLLNRTRDFVYSALPRVDPSMQNDIAQRIYSQLRKVLIKVSLKKKD